MKHPQPILTATDIMAAAAAALAAGSYHEVGRAFPEWSSPTARLFEDEYNIVGVVVFETCQELLNTWQDLQGSLVEVISRYVGRAESKSWDGYLVLLTPAVAPSGVASLEDVRYNTTRLREIVASGTDLRSVSDVERTLKPLLPIETGHTVRRDESVLDLLPQILEKEGVPRDVTAVVVDAFKRQAPLLERLHQHRSRK